MGEAAVEVTDVSKRFRLVHERNSTLKATVFRGFRRSIHEEFWALQDVSFEVPEGSTYGLIGHNGSGKSTLLKCLARIYRPDRGSIRTQGKVSALLELGAGFHPELSGRENVFLNASILGMSRRDVEARFDDIVEFAGLEKFIDTPVKNYSSGMFVRLGFSVAITVEPDVLLVDEVLAVGDEAFQRRCLEKFAELREAGHTVVVVSHGLDTVRNMCDRVAWLDHGELRAEGRAGDVVDRYLDAVRVDRTAHTPTTPGTTSHDEGWDISSVTLCSGGAPVDTIEGGAPLDMVIEFEAPRDESVTMAVSCTRSDGVHAANGSHRFAAHAGSRNTIRYSIPAVPLTNGSFTFNVRLLDEHRTRTYALRTKVVGLEVMASSPGEVGGLVSLGGRWLVDLEAS